MSQDEREKTNPAKRLHAVLEKARSHEGTERTFDVWKSVLGGESLLGTIRRLDWFDRQIEETERQIRRIEDLDHKCYLGGLTSLRGVIDVKHFNQHWGDVKGRLGDVQMTRLHFCSLELDRHAGEFKIEEADLDAIQREVDSLLAEVLNGKLPEPLRAFIVRQLQTIKDAIIEYRLGGVEALEEALERVVGAMFLRMSDLTQNEDEPLVVKFRGIVKRVFQAVQMVRTAVALPGDLEKLTKLLQEAIQ